LHPGLGGALAEAGEAAEQGLQGRDVFHREAHLGLPAPGQGPGQLLQASHRIQQRASTLEDELARSGENAPSALLLQEGNRQLLLQAFDRVAHRGLAAVQRLRGGLEAPLVDHRPQGGPLLKGGPGKVAGHHKASIKTIK